MKLLPLLASIPLMGTPAMAGVINDYNSGQSAGVETLADNVRRCDHDWNNRVNHIGSINTGFIVENGYAQSVHRRRAWGHDTALTCEWGQKVKLGQEYHFSGRTNDGTRVDSIWVYSLENGVLWKYAKNLRHGRYDTYRYSHKMSIGYRCTTKSLGPKEMFGGGVGMKKLTCDSTGETFVVESGKPSHGSTTGGSTYYSRERWMSNMHTMTNSFQAPTR